MADIPEIVRMIQSLLASITRMFDWDALSAIGTVGALWFLAVQSTKSSKAERAKAEGILTFLIGLLEPVEIVSIHEEEGDGQLRDLPIEIIDSDLAIVRRAIAGLNALPLGEAYAVGVVEWVMALPMALKDIDLALSIRRIDPHSAVYDSLRYIQEANAEFRRMRDELRFGLIRRIANKIGRQGADQYSN